MIKYKIYVFLTISIFVVSCGNISPHENFKIHMSNLIGKRIHDSPLWIQEGRKVSTRSIDNGNIEYKYTLVRSCFYIVEVDSKSGVIVGWHFEGSEEDCVIPP